MQTLTLGAIARRWMVKKFPAPTEISSLLLNDAAHRRFEGRVRMLK